MSEENVEIVLRALQAIAERPKPDFETVNALYDPDHVLVAVAATALGEGEAVGGAGFKAWNDEQQSVMPYDLVIEGAIDIERDRVLAVVGVRFHGAASGAQSEGRTWNLITVRNGRIVRTESYRNAAEAIQAAAKEE